MEATQKTEDVTQEQVNALMRSVGPMGSMIARLHEVDISRGRGVLEGNDKCLWTKDGKKITVTLTSDGGICVSCEK